MKQFQLVFGQTERAASDLLNQISRHTTSYLEVTKKGYDEVIKVADEQDAIWLKEHWLKCKNDPKA